MKNEHHKARLGMMFKKFVLPKRISKLISS